MNIVEAVNEVLLALNELPLDANDNISDIPIAVVAEKEILIAKKNILGLGWYFNKMTVSLSPNSAGYIIVPKSFLSVDGSGSNNTITVRDWKLFDKSTLSYKFNKKVECDIIEDLNFDDIPFIFSSYIVATATIKAHLSIIGNSSDVSELKSALQFIRIAAIRDDANNIDGNLLDNNYVSNQTDKTSL